MIFSFLRGLFFFKMVLISTKNIHDKMLEKVARSKILFFDSNPIGRILARFSKDVSLMDFIIPSIGNIAAFYFFRAITIMIVLAIIHPLLIIVFLFSAVFMACFYYATVPVLSEIQRKDSVYRGPIGTSFTNVVSGLVTLRAYQRMPYFRSIFIDEMDKSCNAAFSFILIQRFL